MDAHLSIVDAGPCLTFCAAHTERVLMGVLSGIGTVHVPEAVDDEVTRKSRPGERLAIARRTWVGLKQAQRIIVLSDAASDPTLLEAARLARLDLSAVHRQSRDRSERMAVLHALALRIQGAAPVVLIDDGYGRQLAQANHLQILSTELVLARAAKLGLIRGRGEMRDLYARMRNFDDGLVHIDQTRLLSSDTWA